MAASSIVLDKWYLWMSNDEYIGGGFEYCEGVEIRDNTKSIKLNNGVLTTGWLNRRWSSWLPVALQDNGTEIVMISSDGRIEWSLQNNEYNSRAWYFRRYNDTYLNWFTYAGNIVWMTATKLDRITSTSSLYWSTNLFTNPNITSATWWTVGTWRTTWASGAVHTPWNTADLSQTTSSYTAWDKIFTRIVVRGATTGTLTVKRGATTVWIITWWNDTNSPSSPIEYWLLMGIYTVPSTAAQTFTLTPSSTFDGTVALVYHSFYDLTKMLDSEVTLTTSAKKPFLIRGWLLYVWCWSIVEVIDTTLSTRTKDTTLTLTLDSGDTIVWLTDMWDSITIYTTNGWVNSRQYIWNGVDNAPAELIKWKGILIDWVHNDWNKDFVTTYNQRQCMLYAVSWYQRTLLARSDRSTALRNTYANLSMFKLDTKMNFYNTGNGMTNIWDILYISSTYGMYSYGNNSPVSEALPPSIQKDLVLPYTTNIALNVATTGHVIFWQLQNTTSVLTSSIFTPNTVYYSYFSPGLISWTTGYVITNPILRDVQSTQKNLLKMKLGYVIPSSWANIKVYAKVDDIRFWTFTVSGLTVTPTEWAVYTQTYSARTSTFTVVQTDITAWAGTITCTWVSANWFSIRDPSLWGTWPLVKTSGTWDASITYSDYDNFVLVNTITSSTYKHDSTMIFGKSFVDRNIPYRRKLQLKIELNADPDFNLSAQSKKNSPEVFDLSILAEPVKDDYNG